MKKTSHTLPRTLLFLLLIISTNIQSFEFKKTFFGSLILISTIYCMQRILFNVLVSNGIPKNKKLYFWFFPWVSLFTLDIKNSFGDTALIEAVKKNNVERVKELLEAGANASEEGILKKASILEIFRFALGFIDILKPLESILSFLINFKNYAESRSDKASPVYHAIVGNNDQILKLLLLYGASAKDSCYVEFEKAYVFPLQVAIQEGKAKMLHALVNGNNELGFEYILPFNENKKFKELEDLTDKIRECQKLFNEIKKLKDDDCDSCKTLLIFFEAIKKYDYRIVINICNCDYWNDYWTVIKNRRFIGPKKYVFNIAAALLLYYSFDEKINFFSFENRLFKKALNFLKKNNTGKLISETIKLCNGNNINSDITNKSLTKIINIYDHISINKFIKSNSLIYDIDLLFKSCPGQNNTIIANYKLLRFLYIFSNNKTKRGFIAAREAEGGWKASGKELMLLLKTCKATYKDNVLKLSNTINLPVEIGNHIIGFNVPLKKFDKNNLMIIDCE